MKRSSQAQERQQGLSDTRSSEGVDEDDGEFMDQDEQERLVQFMEDTMKKQQDSIVFAFRVIGYLVAAMGILVAIFVQLRVYEREASSTLNSTTKDTTKSFLTTPLLLWSWLHALLSAGINVRATQFAGWPTNTPVRWWQIYIPFLVMLGVALHIIFLMRTLPQPSPVSKPPPTAKELLLLHQGLVVASSLIIGVAVWLRYDNAASENAVSHLKASTYKHKTL